MKRNIVLSTIVILFSLNIIGCSPKYEWVNDNEKWYYINKEDGTKANGWIKDDGYWYYLNEDGLMQTGWVYDKGNWYYLYSNGMMACDTTIENFYININGAWSEQIPNHSESNNNVEVLYWKTIPVTIESIALGRFGTAEIRVKSEEYNLSGVFFQERNTYYAELAHMGKIQKGDIISAEMNSWKKGDTVTRRSLNRLVKS